MPTSRRKLLGAALAVPVTGAVVFGSSGIAQAAGYTWTRDLSEGAEGEDVLQLQIRVAGYPGEGQVLAIDGIFGPHTESAVAGFQEAYGLTATGVAGSATYDQITALQDDDDTPINFSYEELNTCNSDWSGGNVSSDDAMAAALLSMWKLQALRHAMGDAPIIVSSGFRSVACNDSVGGASDSRHLYGDAVDLTGSHSLCDLAVQAQQHGFGGILGPGYTGHDDHVHLDGRSSQYWSAPSCGIG